MEIFFDTETTGLKPGEDEILSMAIVDGKGKVLFDKRFRPEHHAEWPEAMKFNRITPESVANCDAFRDWAGEIRAIFEDADAVYGYNVGYDLGMVRAMGIEPPEGCRVHDTMRDFAELYGMPNTDPKRPGAWKWQSLSAAAGAISHKWTGAAHGALADTLATLSVQRWCDERREEARGLAHERLVFDRDAYDDDLAAELIAEREGISEAEVRAKYSASELWEEAADARDMDYDLEVGALESFVSGGRSAGQGQRNPNEGNHLIVKGSVGRWDGPKRGMAVYKNVADALDCSSSRFGLGNVFADCEIDKIFDVNGHLHVSGHHHDGAVSVEVRQLTAAGETLLGAGRDLEALWADDDLSEPPRFMEREYGCPAIEYEGKDDHVKLDACRDFFLSTEDPDIKDLLAFHDLDPDMGLRTYTLSGTNVGVSLPSYYAVSPEKRVPRVGEDVHGVLEETLHNLLDNGADADTVCRIMGLVQRDKLDEDDLESGEYVEIDQGYCTLGLIESWKTVPESKATVCFSLEEADERGRGAAAREVCASSWLTAHPARNPSLSAQMDKATRACEQDRDRPAAPEKAQAQGTGKEH